MTEIIIAVIGSGVLSSLVTHFFTKRKTNAEADSTSADAMTKAIEGSVDWADAMRHDILQLRTRQDELSNKYTDLLGKYREVLEENHTLKQEVHALRTELRSYENGKVLTTEVYTK